jgi:hypothetical protein
LGPKTKSKKSIKKIPKGTAGYEIEKLFNRIQSTAANARRAIKKSKPDYLS